MKLIRHWHTFRVSIESSPIGRGMRTTPGARLLAQMMPLAGMLVYMTGLPLAGRFLLVAMTIPVYGHLSGWNWAALGLRLTPLQPVVYWVRITLVLGGIVLVVAAASYVFCEITGIHFEIPRLSPYETSSWLWVRRGCVEIPIVEEGVFRFMLCVPLCAYRSKVTAVVGSGMIFALMHFVGGNPGPDNFVAGYLLAWAYLKSGTIVVPIVLHALGNAVVYALFMAVYLWPF